MPTISDKSHWMAYFVNSMSRKAAGRELQRLAFPPYNDKKRQEMGDRVAIKALATRKKGYLTIIGATKMNLDWFLGRSAKNQRKKKYLHDVN